MRIKNFIICAVAALSVVYPCTCQRHLATAATIQHVEVINVAPPCEIETGTLIKDIEQEQTDVEEEISVSAEDLRFLSAIVWAEARNQCLAGQQAVAIIVMNRVSSELFENTVYKVITQTNQFTPVEYGTFDTGLKMYDNGEISESIIDAATYALRGNTCVIYNNTSIDLKGYFFFSRWVNGCRVKIQDHMFK